MLFLFLGFLHQLLDDFLFQLLVSEKSGRLYQGNSQSHQLLLHSFIVESEGLEGELDLAGDLGLVLEEQVLKIGKERGKGHFAKLLGVVDCEVAGGDAPGLEDELLLLEAVLGGGIGAVLEGGLGAEVGYFAGLEVGGVGVELGVEGDPVGVTGDALG